MATIEDLEKRLALDERYLNAVVRGFEKMLVAAGPVLRKENDPAVKGLKDAVRDARTLLHSAKNARL
ncbi:MAG: hypothetical protein ACLQU2_30025 [Candidatus Binataceae bacterium]